MVGAASMRQRPAVLGTPPGSSSLDPEIGAFRDVNGPTNGHTLQSSSALDGVVTIVPALPPYEARWGVHPGHCQYACQLSKPAARFECALRCGLKFCLISPTAHWICQHAAAS